MVIPNLKFSKMGGGGGDSGLQFKKGVNWRIWTKIYCSARNLLVHHNSLSHTTYVETYECGQVVFGNHMSRFLRTNFYHPQLLLREGNVFIGVVLCCVQRGGGRPESTFEHHIR